MEHIKLKPDASIKAWYLMRLDLPMTQGKFGVQIGHGTDMIHINAQYNKYYSLWIDPLIGNRRKTVLRTANEESLHNIKKICEEAGMIVDYIADAGLTEFGKPTITGIVIHPHDGSLIPKELKRAQIWRDTDGFKEG